MATPRVSAQERAQRVYLPDAADEDWSFLKDAEHIDRWDPLKYIPLGREDWFATLSGEVRYRPEGLRIHNDAGPATVDNYLLQRYLVGGNVRMGRRTRVFAQVQSGIINGSLRTPRPSDRNSVDLHQAFLEWKQPASTSLVVRVGRQELAVGSTRLISASPGLNVKRSFDGVGVSYAGASWSFAGAAARLVGLEPGIFDDRSASGQTFWGVAASRRSPRFEKGELGGYYLGIDRRNAFYAQGVGPERRHTLGVKWTGTGARLSLNYDALFQWGTFASYPIRAFAFATETSFAPTSTGWRPRLSVRFDLASGDRDRDDDRLEAFNPLFPGNAYSGAVGLLGPTNLTDLTPAVTLRPFANVTLGVEAPSYWRTSNGDGVYATDLRLLIPPGAGKGNYVGTNPGVVAVWQATRHVQLQGAVTRFLSGPFLERTFVASGFGFYSASVIYRF